MQHDIICKLNLNNYLFVSLFPSILKGWVKNLNISDVKLLPIPNGSYYIVYAGGFSSYVKSPNRGILLENIQVSNIEFSIKSSQSLSVSEFVAIGGIVGVLTENTDETGSVTMNNCNFLQPLIRVFKDSTSSDKMFFGGLIGDAFSADVALTNCHVAFGGSQEVPGTTVKMDGPTPYVGSAIGRAYDNNIQIVTSLLLEGHIQFIGSSNESVKKVIGKRISSTVTGQDLVTMTNLVFRKKSSTNATNYDAPDW